MSSIALFKEDSANQAIFVERIKNIVLLLVELGLSDDFEKQMTSDGHVNLVSNSSD